MVRGDLQNKEMVGYNCSPTASMRNLKYFLADAAKHKSRVHQLDFIGVFLQSKVSTRFYKTTFPSDMVFTKEDVSTSDEKG